MGLLDHSRVSAIQAESMGNIETGKSCINCFLDQLYLMLNMYLRYGKHFQAEGAGTREEQGLDFKPVSSKIKIHSHTFAAGLILP